MKSVYKFLSILVIWTAAIILLLNHTATPKEIVLPAMSLTVLIILFA